MCPQEAECERAAMDVKYSTDTKIEDNTKAFKLQKAQFDREVNTAVRPRDSRAGRGGRGRGRPDWAQPRDKLAPAVDADGAAGA